VPLPRPKILPPSAAPGQPAAAEASDKVETRIVALRRGDTLAGVLSREGVARADIHAVVMALKPYYDPRHLRAGQDVEVTLASHDAATGTAAATHLLRVAISPDIERALRAERRDDGGFAIEEVVTPLQASMVRVAGEIRSNVYLALAKAGMPSELILGLIQMFSYTVDFQRDIQPGDRFEILYETFYDQDGRAVRTGEIQFGRLILGGKEFRLYRYVTDDGRVGYYDAEGRSNRKALMRTPIDGARLSSGFGMRRHPVLGYSRMHRGVDFAAPQGTPIMAAGDGVVEFVGRKSGYGNFIKLRHFAGYSTGYAHLSRFAKTIQNGAKVRQGDIIGYVGSTGLATGPHLHFEVFRNGNQIDPASADLPEHQLLAGAEREKFASRRAVIERQIAQTPLLRALAQATESE
jgi:murein DD-endopeptidase MepM/ murein hydrolase activator NlpD